MDYVILDNQLVIAPNDDPVDFTTEPIALEGRDRATTMFQTEYCFGPAGPIVTADFWLQVSNDRVNWVAVGSPISVTGDAANKLTSIDVRAVHGAFLRYRCRYPSAAGAAGVTALGLHLYLHLDHA